jgi:hypothetical protein
LTRNSIEVESNNERLIILLDEIKAQLLTAACNCGTADAPRALELSAEIQQKDQIIKTLTKENLLSTQNLAQLQTQICAEESSRTELELSSCQLRELKTQHLLLKQHFEASSNYLLDVEGKC